MCQYHFLHRIRTIQLELEITAPLVSGGDCWLKELCFENNRSFSSHGAKSLQQKDNYKIAGCEIWLWYLLLGLQSLVLVRGAASLLSPHVSIARRSISRIELDGRTPLYRGIWSVRVTGEAVGINTGVCPKGQIVSQIHAVYHNCFLLLSALIKGNNEVSLSSGDVWQVSLPCSGQGVQVWGRQPPPLPAACQCVSPQDAAAGAGAHTAARQRHRHHALPGQGRAHHPAGEGTSQLTQMEMELKPSAEHPDSGICLMSRYIWSFAWNIDHSAVGCHWISMPAAEKSGSIQNRMNRVRAWCPFEPCDKFCLVQTLPSKVPVAVLMMSGSQSDSLLFLYIPLNKSPLQPSWFELSLQLWYTRLSTIWRTP